MPQTMPRPHTGGLPMGLEALRLDESSTDNFLMHCYKVVPCGKRYRHDWSVCPFAHTGEMAARRDPSKYMPVFCAHAKQRIPCPKGDDCLHAHNLFEMHLHPLRYRTELCQFGPNCNRPVCFFAHSPEQLRVTGYTGNIGQPAGPVVDASAGLSLEQQLVMLQLQQLSGVGAPTQMMGASQQLDGSYHGRYVPAPPSGPLSACNSGPLPAPLSSNMVLMQQLQQQQQAQAQQQAHAQAQQQLAGLRHLVSEAAGAEPATSMGRVSPPTPAMLSPSTGYVGSPLNGDDSLSTLHMHMARMQMGGDAAGLDPHMPPMSAPMQMGGMGGDAAGNEHLLNALTELLSLGLAAPPPAHAGMYSTPLPRLGMPGTMGGVAVGNLRSTMDAGASSATPLVGLPGVRTVANSAPSSPLNNPADNSARLSGVVDARVEVAAPSSPPLKLLAIDDDEGALGGEGGEDATQLDQVKDGPIGMEAAQQLLAQLPSSSVLQLLNMVAAQAGNP